MNKTMMACALAAMMIGGIAYAEDSTPGTNTSSTTVSAGRGQGRRAHQADGTAVRGQRGNQDGTQARSSEGRQKAAANIKAMDKDGDGNISKSEATGRIAKHFDKIDKDGNNSLSPAELKAMRHHKRQNNGENAQRTGNGKVRGAKRQAPADTSK